MCALTGHLRITEALQSSLWSPVDFHSLLCILDRKGSAESLSFLSPLLSLLPLVRYLLTIPDLSRRDQPLELACISRYPIKAPWPPPSLCRLPQSEKGDVRGVKDRAERNAGGGVALTCGIHRLLRVWVGYRGKGGEASTYKNRLRISFLTAPEI